MIAGVEEFVYGLLTDVFNAAGTGTLGLDAILAAGSYDMGPKASRTEDPAEWTKEKSIARAVTLHKQDSPGGHFDD